MEAFHPGSPHASQRAARSLASDSSGKHRFLCISAFLNSVRIQHAHPDKHASADVLQTPSYPQPDRVDVRCPWTLTAWRGLKAPTQLQLQVTDLSPIFPKRGMTQLTEKMMKMSKTLGER
jgi:hypothetical protein